MTKHINTQIKRNRFQKPSGILRAGLIAFAIVLPSLPATAAPYKGADKTYESTDYTSETFAVIRSAEEGSSCHQSVLGTKYRNGDGVPQSHTLAMYWYLKAAAQGDADAHADIGSLYYLGLGVAESKQDAARWYEKAGLLGHEKGEKNAAIIIASGDAEPQLKQSVGKWIAALSEEGDVNAIKWMAKAHASGDGAYQSAFKAAEYFQKAADLGDEEAMYELGLAYRYGKGRAKSDVEALKWFDKAFRETPKARYELALMYETGAGGQLRPDRAAVLYRNSIYAFSDRRSVRGLQRMAHGGSGPAQTHLAAHYESTSNDKEAISLEKMAAEQGDLVGMCMYGQRLLEGRGVTKDMEAGFQFIRASALAEDPCGMARLGIMFLDGVGLEQSYEQALLFLTKADKKFSVEAGMRVDEAHIGHRRELDEKARALERRRAEAQARVRARERAAEAKRAHQRWKAEKQARANAKAQAWRNYGGWDQAMRDFSPFRSNGAYKMCSRNGSGKVSCY